MPTKQYCDYIAEQKARRERIEQQFPVERIEQTKQPFWMHSIERKENPGEMNLLTGIMFVVGIGIIIALFYFSR